MDIFLGRVTQQAMNYAIRSGISITAGYAIQQSARLLRAVEGNERDDLSKLQLRLESKIRIISPAIDMIELISARGNTSLESAVTLTTSLRWDIQALGQSLAQLASEEEELHRSAQKGSTKVQNGSRFKQVIAEIRKVLDRIEDAVPLINLAITTSGANLSTSLPATISPSRLLQASTFLTAGDSQYASLRSSSVQIGPTFTLSLYMLFQGHLRPQNEEQVRNSTWQEVIHKARLKLLRIPLGSLYDSPDTINDTIVNSTAEHISDKDFPAELRSDEYAYKVIIIEDFDDDRVHTFEEVDHQAQRCDDVFHAGIREAIPVHEISKIFYADTGKILNIGGEAEVNNPVLLLKRDLDAVPPRRMVQRFNESEEQIIESVEQPSSPPSQKQELSQDELQAQIDAQLGREHRESSVHYASLQSTRQWRIPPNIDPEWLAFEVYTESMDSDTESETLVTPASQPSNSRAHSLDPNLNTALSSLHLDSSSSPSPAFNPSAPQHLIPTPSRQTLPTIRTSLSLLETLLRLLSLQQFQQTSHLSIPDELLNFFLSEAATTGAATGDEVTRRRLRAEARQRVGFDPYDESPIKRRGEEYQYRGGTSQVGEAWNEPSGRLESESPNDGGWSQEQGRYTSPQDEGYGTYRFSDAQQPQSRVSQSPQRLLEDRRQSSRSSTPDSGLPPLPKSSSSDNARRMGLLAGAASPRTPPSLQGRFRSLQQAAARKGSPLARPRTGLTDEGVELSSGGNEGKQA